MSTKKLKHVVTVAVFAGMVAVVNPAGNVVLAVGDSQTRFG